MSCVACSQEGSRCILLPLIYGQTTCRLREKNGKNQETEYMCCLYRKRKQILTILFLCRSSCQIPLRDSDCLAFADFYCSGGCVTYPLLYVPLYFKHILLIHSAEHTAGTLTFIDAPRIHKVNV